MTIIADTRPWNNARLRGVPHFLGQEWSDTEGKSRSGKGNLKPHPKKAETLRLRPSKRLPFGMWIAQLVARPIDTLIYFTRFEELCVLQSDRGRHVLISLRPIRLKSKVHE